MESQRGLVIVCGQFYQGFVDDDKSVLLQHYMATVTTYGVRKSRTCASLQTDPETYGAHIEL